MELLIIQLIEYRTAYLKTIFYNAIKWQMSI